MIAISPPRLSYKAFMEGERSAEFRQSIENSRTAISEGGPESLVDENYKMVLRWSEKQRKQFDLL